MAGLVPATLFVASKKDARDKPGHDEQERLVTEGYATPSAFSTWHTEAAVFATISSSSASVAL